MPYKIIVEKEKCPRCGSMVNPDMFGGSFTCGKNGEPGKSEFHCSYCWRKTDEEARKMWNNSEEKCGDSMPGLKFEGCDDRHLVFRCTCGRELHQWSLDQHRCLCKKWWDVDDLIEAINAAVKGKEK